MYVHAVFRNFLLYSNDEGTDLLMENGCNTCLEHLDGSNIVNDLYGFFPSLVGARLDIAIVWHVLVCNDLPAAPCLCSVIIMVLRDTAIGDHRRCC